MLDILCPVYDQIDIRGISIKVNCSIVVEITAIYIAINKYYYSTVTIDYIELYTSSMKKVSQIYDYYKQFN